MIGEMAQHGRPGRDGTLDAEEGDLRRAVGVFLHALEFLGLGADGPAGRPAELDVNLPLVPADHFEAVAQVRRVVDGFGAGVVGRARDSGSPSSSPRRLSFDLSQSSATSMYLIAIRL